MASRKASPKSVVQGWVVYAGIVCATVIAYLPALSGGLLWDDTAHVTRPDLQSWEGLWRIWSVPGATQQYYPLLHSAFWVEHRIWGDSVLWYHLLNVALHALSACLLVKIVRRLGLRGGWLAGLLFALHPLGVEAVAWISEEKSTLSAVFYLASALAYLRFDETRRRSAYLAGLGLFFAALLAKTVTAVLPAVLLVVLWWRRGRLEWRRDMRPLVPWLALAAGAGLFTAWLERTLIGARGVEFALGPIERVLLAGRALWFYAWKVIWPVDLEFFYPRWRIDAGEWWQWMFPVGVAAAAVAMWRFAKRNRGPLAGFLVFAGTLFPVLGFFNVYPFRYSFVADHFAYLAMLGVLVPAAAMLSRRVWAGVAVAAVLAVLTFRQAGAYRDEETLYRATLERNPDAWLAQNNLGNLLLADGRRAEAMAHLEAALRLRPDAMEPHLSMGNALLDAPERLDDAIAEYRTAARIAPGSERVHTNLGNALLRSGRTEEAVAQLREALRIDPNNAEAHNDLGNALTQMRGRLEDAIVQYRAALRANPEFAEAHNNLGRALAAMPGQVPEAIAEFEAAIRLKPGYANAHSNLGNALSMMPGRLRDAVAEYREAVRLRPDSASAHNNLGYALSQMPGSLAEALSEFREAVRLDPGSADAHYNLGAALTLVPGHQQEALAEFETVMRLRPNARIEQIIRQLHERK